MKAEDVPGVIFLQGKRFSYRGRMLVTRLAIKAVWQAYLQVSHDLLDMS